MMAKDFIINSNMAFEYTGFNLVISWRVWHDRARGGHEMT